MSIFTEVKRISDLRNAIRTKLLSWGLVSDAASLEDCKTAIDGIVDHTGKTTDGAFAKGETGYITGQILEKGYYDEASKLKIPVANFAEENIKNGVNIGGKVGTYYGNYELSNHTNYSFFQYANVPITILTDAKNSGVRMLFLIFTTYKQAIFMFLVNGIPISAMYADISNKSFINLMNYYNGNEIYCSSAKKIRISFGNDIIITGASSNAEWFFLHL